MPSIDTPLQQWFRVPRTAGGSTIIALPSAWASANAADLAGTLRITLHADGTLRIYPQPPPKPAQPAGDADTGATDGQFQLQPSHNPPQRPDSNPPDSNP